MNRKSGKKVTDEEKSAIFSLGLITLNIIYEIFKTKISSPEFRSQLTENELQSLILDIEFDLLYDKHSFSIDFDYLSNFLTLRFFN